AAAFLQKGDCAPKRVHRGNHKQKPVGDDDPPESAGDATVVAFVNAIAKTKVPPRGIDYAAAGNLCWAILWLPPPHYVKGAVGWASVRPGEKKLASAGGELQELRAAEIDL